MTKLERLEIICGLAWFASDGCWLMQWGTPCYLAGIVAVLSGAAIFALQPRMPVPLLICGADSAWLAFNIFWSFGDLLNIIWCLDVAKLLFGAGGALYLCALTVSKGSAAFLVLRRLRLLKLLSRPTAHARPGG